MSVRLTALRQIEDEAILTGIATNAAPYDGIAFTGPGATERSCVGPLHTSPAC